MTRLFLPAILVIAGIGLFWLYTNPAYQDIKSLSLQNTSFDDALNKAQELRSVRDQLLAKNNSFAPADVDKLKHILPDNVDNIRLIIGINNIASRHNLALSAVNLGDIGGGSSAAAAAASGPVGSVEVGFSVSTSNYDDYLAFVQDLEHSLRLVDITKIAFTVGTGTAAPIYTMSARTYWLH